MNSDFSIVVFISGRGSNLKSLIDGQQHYKIKAVITDKKDASGLNFAIKNNIQTFSFERKNYESKKIFWQAIETQLLNLNPKLIALAGFMKIIPKNIIDQYYGHLVNIHPSLLPNFPGLDTHQRFIDSSQDLHGCTTHYVDSGIDTGPIIAQASLARKKEHTSQTIATEVLKLEHKLYPDIINLIAQNNIVIKNNKVSYTDKALKVAKENNYKFLESSNKN